MCPSQGSLNELNPSDYGYRKKTIMDQLENPLISSAIAGLEMFKASVIQLALALRNFCFTFSGKYEYCYTSYVSRVQLEPQHCWLNTVFFLLGIPPHSGKI